MNFEDDLTLVTHASASALDEIYLSELLANWRGPISLAVSLQGKFNEDFVKRKIESTLSLLTDQRDAHRFSVHIMFERDRTRSCHQSVHRLGVQAVEDVYFASYPINTVRNVARLFSSTRYIAFADSDYLFSNDFYTKILAILRENVPLNSKNVLNYRIFEIEDKSARLRNHQLSKVDLKELIAANKARVFHVQK
ncbi:hypothetical protein PENTCL1PPCAC_30087, partial [Pristionchus entomophagus]